MRRIIVPLLLIVTIINITACVKKDEADHIYSVKADLNKTTMTVLLERTLDDITLQGEIEGLPFDKNNNKLFVSYNRGAHLLDRFGNNQHNIKSITCH